MARASAESSLPLMSSASFVLRCVASSGMPLFGRLFEGSMPSTAAHFSAGCAIYVLTARAKGCSERQVLYGHVFRNAMLIVIAGFPGAFIHAFFTGALLIETIFSLDGLGLLGFESVLNRDYPVVFATLYIFSLVGLVVNLLSDLTYTWVDPRIDFETREV